VWLRLVGTRYERAAIAAASADGGGVSLDLPTERDRTRVFASRPGTTPPAVELIDEPKGYVLGGDILPGSLSLPSGRVLVGEYLFDAEPLDLRVRPGAYPVHATLARHRTGGPHDVALATVVLSERPTVRWKQGGSFAVDGGSATLTSPEGASVINRLDEPEWWRLHNRIFDSVVAHEYLLTELSLRPGVNLFNLSSGVGDGVYPVFIGLDASGRPTRVVVDFLLLHLDWPS
jgi:Protein of unknown function (DUF4241)